MLCFVLLALLCSVTFRAGAIDPRASSYSGEYGGDGGKPFSHSRNQFDGSITAVRLRVNSLYIVGLQVRYGIEWSTYVGGSSGELKEISLYPEESIIQVFGKYNLYLQRLTFFTDMGRIFSIGKDRGRSFNAVPIYPVTVLRYFSGHSDFAINAIGFHWDNYPSTDK